MTIKLSSGADCEFAPIQRPANDESKTVREQAITLVIGCIKSIAGHNWQAMSAAEKRAVYDGLPLKDKTEFVRILAEQM